jgi:hypothetical protein
LEQGQQATGPAGAAAAAVVKAVVTVMMTPVVTPVVTPAVTVVLMAVFYRSSDYSDDGSANRSDNSRTDGSVFMAVCYGSGDSNLLLPAYSRVAPPSCQVSYEPGVTILILGLMILANVPQATPPV